MRNITVPNRRNMLRALCRGLAAAVLLSATLLPHAPSSAAPTSTAPQPGFFREYVGTFEVTALNDGTIELPVDKLLVGPPATIANGLAANDLTTPLTTSVNAFLINTGSKVVLIDTGIGAMPGAPTVGRLIANLRAAGYGPEQVDDIFITHMHGDHIGGLTSNGARAFPNATVHTSAAEAAYWLDASKAATAPALLKDTFAAAQASFAPYKAAGSFKTFSTDGPVVPGIRAIITGGHTPGHAVYIVESAGQQMIIVGDLIHVGSVQFANPNVAIAFDSDQQLAIKERKLIFDQAISSNASIAAAHLPFPGIGHIKADGTAYRYLPANYALGAR